MSSTGTASSLDYNAVDETVIFQVGVSSLQISVSFIPDALDEEDETFTLLLTSAINATLGDIIEATVTIIDGDDLTTDEPVIEAGMVKTC